PVRVIPAGTWSPHVCSDFRLGAGASASPAMLMTMRGLSGTNCFTAPERVIVNGPTPPAARPAAHGSTTGGGTGLIPCLYTIGPTLVGLVLELKQPAPTRIRPVKAVTPCRPADLNRCMIWVPFEGQVPVEHGAPHRPTRACAAPRRVVGG